MGNTTLDKIERAIVKKLSVQTRLKTAKSLGVPIEDLI